MPAPSFCSTAFRTPPGTSWSRRSGTRENSTNSPPGIAQSSRILEEAYRCEGLNVGANLGEAAGAGFAEHLHFHLVPRWFGDINFMTTLAETRVMPQHLDQSYAELAPRFAALSGL